MDPVKALEIYDLVVKVYESYMTRTMILVGVGGFILGMLTCLLISANSILKSLKHKDDK